MAGNDFFAPVLAKRAPLCFRVLTPFMNSLLPFSTLTNFRVLAFLSNVISIYLMVLILGKFDFQPISRIFGTLLYAGSFWTLKFSFYSPAYIDYQTQLLLLLIIYLTLRRAYVVLPFVFIIAVLQKESLIAYSVFCVIHIMRRSMIPRIWVRIVLALAILLLPLVTYFVVRLFIDAQNSHSPTVIVDHFRRAMAPRYWPILLQAIFSGPGIIPVILLINYGSWVRFIREHWEWSIYAIVSVVLLFGGYDKARLFLYSLPVVTIFAVCTLEELKQCVSPRVFVVWGCTVLIVHWYIGGYLTPLGPVVDYLARMVPEHSDGRYMPYLLHNLCFGLAVFVFTIQFIFGGWYFSPTIGFTRRDKAQHAESQKCWYN